MTLASSIATWNAWVTCPRPRPDAEMRLFCFPYAGGGASAYRAWAAHAPETLEVCPVQLPGRENRLREPLYTRLPALVASLHEVIRPFLDRPFAFFGHSLGAIIAFELARELRRRGGELPQQLFVSARLAPQDADPEPPMYVLPDDEFRAQLRKLSGTPEAILQNEELMAMLLPILRADFAINEAYVYAEEPPLSCPISAFGGHSDPKVSQGELERWHAQTSGSFSLRMQPGNHFFINSDPKRVVGAIAQDCGLDAGRP